MNNYIIEFNNIVNDDKMSHICNIDDYNDMMLVESSGTIYNDNWDKFLTDLFKSFVKLYKKEGMKLKKTVGRETFEKYGCKFPGGKKFDFVIFVIDDEDYIASWKANEDFEDGESGYAVCYINYGLLNCGEYTEKAKNNFIEVLIHELTHGFNRQNNYTRERMENIVNSRDIKSKIFGDNDYTCFDDMSPYECLSFLEYLLRDTELNARVSELAVASKNKLKRNFRNKKYPYTFKGLRKLMNDCEDTIYLGEIEKFIELLEERDVFYDFEQFNNNFERILSFDIGKESKEHMFKEIGNSCEIVSIIFLSSISGGKYIYDFSMYKFENVENNKEEYDKIYDEIIEQTKYILDKFFRRCVKVTNKVMVDYYEKNPIGDGAIDFEKMKNTMLNDIESFFKMSKTIGVAIGMTAKRGGKKLIKKAKNSDILNKVKEFINIQD